MQFEKKIDETTWQSWIGNSAAFGVSEKCLFENAYILQDYKLVFRLKAG